jgi:hypothetical protein
MDELALQCFMQVERSRLGGKDVLTWVKGAELSAQFVAQR